MPLPVITTPMVHHPLWSTITHITYLYTHYLSHVYPHLETCVPNNDHRYFKMSGTTCSVTSHRTHPQRPVFVYGTSHIHNHFKNLIVNQMWETWRVSKLRDTGRQPAMNRIHYHSMSTKQCPLIVCSAITSTCSPGHPVTWHPIHNIQKRVPICRSGYNVTPGGGFFAHKCVLKMTAAWKQIYCDEVDLSKFCILIL
jgi:hypothetical protein